MHKHQVVARVDSSMQFEHPVALKVLIAFLRAGRVLDHTSSLLLLVTFFLAFLITSSVMTIMLAAAFVLALVEKYFAWRVALDAELFQVLCEYHDEERMFDVYLAAMLGRDLRGDLRSMESRWSGAKRLLHHQFWFLMLQAICLVTSIAVIPL